MSLIKHILIVWISILSLATHAADVDKNFSAYYKKSCTFVNAKDYGDDWCNPGNDWSKDPNTILMGDSYSNSLTTFFDAIIASKKASFVYRQFGRGQCPSLIGYGPEYCIKFANDEFEYVKNTPSVKNVVLAAHWDVYYNGKNFSWVNYQATSEQFKDSLVATIKAYQAIKKNVVVILQPPILNVDPHTCISRGVSISDKDKCVMQKSDIDSQQSYKKYMLSTLKVLNVQFFDPTQYFCSDDKCIFKSDDKVFTTGGVHISGNGGDFLANNTTLGIPFFDSQLDAFLGGNTEGRHLAAQRGEQTDFDGAAASPAARRACRQNHAGHHHHGQQNVCFLDHLLLSCCV